LLTPPFALGEGDAGYEAVENWESAGEGERQETPRTAISYGRAEGEAEGRGDGGARRCIGLGVGDADGIGEAEGMKLGAADSRGMRLGPEKLEAQEPGLCGYWAG
jgi:hypothetical protein